MTQLARWQLVGFSLVVLFAMPARVHAEEDTETAEAAAEEEDAPPLGTHEETRTLAQRIPSVTRRSFVKRGRLEVFPSVGLSLNDPFYDHGVVSGGLAFHVLESLSVGVSGDFLVSRRVKVPIAGGENVPFSKINRPAYAGRLEVAWAPFYGKLSLLAEYVLHFDIYAILGGGVVGMKKGDPAVAGVAGVGQHFFLNDWFALRLELREQLFTMSRSFDDPTRERAFQGLFTANIGFCFYLPASFEREAL